MTHCLAVATCCDNIVRRCACICEELRYGARVHLGKRIGCELAALCRFLEIADDPGLLAPGRARGADGRPFAANSSHAAVAPGARPELAERWRTTLAPDALALVELVCGAEMQAAGIAVAGLIARDAASRRLREDAARVWSWRTDAGDPDADLAFELARRALINRPADADVAQVRRCFLWPEALAALAAPRP